MHHRVFAWLSGRLSSGGTASSERNLAIAAVLAGVFLYSILDISMKVAVLEFGTFTAIFFRLLFAVILVVPFYLLRRPKRPSKQAFLVHCQRGLVQVFMAFAFFWGMQFVPLAEAITLSFVAPLIAVYLAHIWLGEVLLRGSVRAGFISLVGVMIMGAHKFGENLSDEALLGFAAIFGSTFLYAINLVLQRKQSLISNPMETAAIQNVIAFIAYALAAPLFLKIPALDANWAAPIIATLASVGAMLFMIWGYARAPTGVTINLEYSALIWVSILGYIILEEIPSGWIFLGAGFIIYGGYSASRLRGIE